MRKTRTGFTVLSFLLNVVGLGAQSGEPGMKIEVQIYNYSAFSAETLARTEQETSRIFERIGVTTILRFCPHTSQEEVRNEACTLPEAPTRLTLRLFSNSKANRGKLGADVFGYALLPANEGFGVAANVYADRIQKPPDGGECAEVILGRLIAHELGHLLLGRNGHSAAGIMHTPWRREDLELHRGGAMLFLPGEAKRIRAQVLARMSSANTR